jgi:hypothetical protein
VEVGKKTFSVSQGWATIRALGDVALVLFAIILGIALHFAWEIFTAAVRSGVEPDFGSRGLIIARLGIAFIVGMVSFIGIYRQLDGSDRVVRFFLALTQGFAIDALTAPLGPASDDTTAS